MPEKPSKVSRREFARRVAVASAAGTFAPVESLLAAQTPADSGSQEVPQNFPKLAPQSRAEAEARFDAILREYPDRFSDTEKKDLRRLCYVIQSPLDHLRAYAIENSDNPALYLKPIVERERRSVSTREFIKRSKKR